MNVGAIWLREVMKGVCGAHRVGQLLPETRDYFRTASIARSNSCHSDTLNNVTFPSQRNGMALYTIGPQVPSAWLNPSQ